jgi:hypothetical protein
MPEESGRMDQLNGLYNMSITVVPDAEGHGTTIQLEK